MKKSIFYLLFLFAFNFIYGQTNVSGGLFSNTTWDINGSPYIVTDDVALFPGYTLTIDPGVIVKFDSEKKLIIRGLFICNGLDNNMITFTSNDSSPTVGIWDGIKIENAQGGKLIGSYIYGEYADQFIRIMDTSNGEVLNLNNSEFKYNNFVFYGKDGSSSHQVVLDYLSVSENISAFIYAQNVTLTNSVFSDGEKGIHGWEPNPNIFISDCEFYNFSVYPFNLEGVIDNCHIHDNAVGIKMKPNLIVKNSTIEFNTIGIADDYPIPISGANIYDNKICDNTEYNFKHYYSYPITIANNCWCSEIEDEISETIYDGYDNVDLGIVTFSPFNVDCSSSLATNDVSDNLNKIVFYPNPSKNIIYFENDSFKYIEVYSINGILIKKEIAENNLDISELYRGVYIMKIYNEDKTNYSLVRLLKD
ncbi:MAG: hypothetical protein COB12_07035 [Flavobacterium sp.]|nr:MAG: hypothetical protein COB12_07035 [Flavobacterium sp.]